MSDWQPIETAPKDGREIILGEAADACAGFWSTAENRRSWSDPAGNWFAEMDRGNEFSAKPLSPTHWMPLPAPPTDAGPSRSAGRDGPCPA